MDEATGDFIRGALGVVLIGGILILATQCDPKDDPKPQPSTSASVKPTGKTIEYPDCQDTQPPCLRDEAGTLAVIVDYSGQREPLPGAKIIRTEVRGKVRWHTVMLP